MVLVVVLSVMLIQPKTKKNQIINEKNGIDRSSHTEKRIKTVGSKYGWIRMTKG